MDDNLAILLVVGTAIVAAVILTVAMAWLRGRNRVALAGASETIAALTAENGRLIAEMSRLGERTAVLERIATDPGVRTASEIAALR
jgi:hypothetical protein